MAITGTPSSGLRKWKLSLFFGTDSGWVYRLSSTDGRILPGWPYLISGGPEVVAQAIDVREKAVLFSTDDGRLYSFDLR